MTGPARRVVIWRSAMLPGSETFVRNHGRYLTRWQPVYAGATRIESPLAEAADVIAFPSGRFLGLRLTGRSPRLRSVLAGVRPDLVHAHFGGDGWLVARAATGVPLIVTVHGHDVTRQPAAPGLRGLRYRRNLRAVFGRAALVLAVSEHIREQAVRYGADPARTLVHHTGVPMPGHAEPVEKRWDVVFAGRFVAKKGVDDLIAALRRLPGVRALFIGSGPLLETMRSRAHDLDATFLGAQPPAVVAAEMAAAKVLAAPSRTAADGDSEGLPTTVLEAAALGVPVVATRHSGIPEAVVDGATGLLGPENDPAALAVNLDRLLRDDELRSRLGAQARLHVADHFDLRKQSALLEGLYDLVVTGDAAPRGGAAARP